MIFGVYMVDLDVSWKKSMEGGPVIGEKKFQELKFVDDVAIVSDAVEALLRKHKKCFGKGEALGILGMYKYLCFWFNYKGKNNTQNKRLRIKAKKGS